MTSEMGCNGLVLRREKKPEPPMSQLGSKPVNSRSEQLFSDLPPEADLTADIVEVSQASKNEITYRFHSGRHIATLRLVFVH